MLTFSVEEYMLLENEYRAGKLSQKQTLEELNKKYKATLNYIRRKITSIMKKSELYLLLPDTIDELINICDKTKNCPDEPERKKYTNIYSKLIADFISNIKKQPSKFGAIGKLDTNLIYPSLDKARDEIAEICRVKKRIDEYYEKYVVEIESIPDRKIPLSEIDNPALMLAFTIYPQFKDDYNILKNNYIVIEVERKLKWQKSIKSLAEYFGNLPLQEGKKKRDWNCIEKLFNKKDLKNHFISNDRKHSKDYDDLLILLGEQNTLNSK